MNNSFETQKREEFKRILRELAVSQEVLKEPEARSRYFLKLEKLYYLPDTGTFFRHFYSDIFMVLSEIKLDPSFGNIVFIGENLQRLREDYKRQNKDERGKDIDISDCLRKLSDHVNLDIARLDYTEGRLKVETGEATINDLKAKVNSLEVVVEKEKRSFEQTKTDVDNMKSDLEKSKTEYISILGIFSSVVLAFTAGIAFTSSVLENIASASIYRTVMITLVIGLVLINIISLMFYYIGCLTDKDVNKAPVLPMNIIMIILMVLVVIGWYLGIVENRDRKIFGLKESNSSIVNEITINDIENSNSVNIEDIDN